MLRCRFFQDTVLTHNAEFVKREKERDLEYNLGLELFNDNKVDVLNPFENLDLLENLKLYLDDWNSFVKETNYKI